MVDYTWLGNPFSYEITRIPSTLDHSLVALHVLQETSTVAPPLLQVWQHQEPRRVFLFHRWSGCQLDDVTISLCFWFEVSKHVQCWNICLGPVKHWFWMILAAFNSRPLKKYPVLQGIQKVGTIQLPDFLQKLPCDPAVHNKRNHVQKYPGSPIASAKRKTQPLFEVGT